MREAEAVAHDLAVFGRAEAQVQFVLARGGGAAYFGCAEVSALVLVREGWGGDMWVGGVGGLEYGPHSVHESELDGFLEVGLEVGGACFLALLGGGGLVFAPVFEGVGGLAGWSALLQEGNRGEDGCGGGAEREGGAHGGEAGGTVAGW